MLSTMAGLLTLAFAPSYGMLLVGAALLGIGSSIFHPESSRIARLSSGGAHGLAQSVFQVGGNFGSALGPLMAAYVIGAAALGTLADRAGIGFVYQICSFLPLIGLLTALLPNIESTANKRRA
jgi:FSR family fosmidomycin resistance protein-like MFS transporter